MKRLSALLFVLTFALGVAAAQQPEAPKPAERPPQDPKAVAMLEKFDSLVYIPRAAGLKDLEFTLKLPVGFNVLVRWKASPDRARADLVVPEDAPAGIKKQLEIRKSTVEADARKQAVPLSVTQVGEVQRDKYKDDEIVLVAPNQVKIVARSEASKSAFKEHTVTFNDQGLVTLVKVVAPNNFESTIEPTFAESNGKHAYQSIKTTIGRQETIVAYEYVSAGSFQFVKKITTTAKGSGDLLAPPPQSIEFDGFKPNAGIDDAVFEGK